MTKYKLVVKKTINGKKRNIYKKEGSKKEYLKYKGRMMNVVKYKKIKTKKTKKKVKKTLKKRVKKIKGGDNEFLKKVNLYNLRSIGGVEAFWDEAKRDAYNNNFEKTKILLALFKYSNKIQNISEPKAFIEWLNIETTTKINDFHELVVEEEEK